MSEEEITQKINSCKASIANGNISSQSIGDNLMAVYCSVRRRRYGGQKINDRTK